MTSRITVIGYCLLVIGMTSCSDMLETESDLVEFEENHTLNHATDSVYSVMGILNKMQVIADRVVVLGEVRGDLMLPTQAASTDLKRLSAFDFKEANSYNRISDYYAVINNCNYYLAHVDTAMERRGRNLFLREYAVVKSYRAWTYLQLALAYGKVPLVLQPLMTEKEAREAMSQTPADIQTICETFINDLTPFVGVNLPDFGSINSMSSEDFFIPMRVLLGDLCLWAGRYQEAARWYHDYLTDRYDPIQMSTQRIIWPNSTQYGTPLDNYNPTGDREVLCYIPMEPTVFSGNISNLPNLFNSTRENNYFYGLTPSSARSRIAADQIYCFEESMQGATTKDTIYAPRTGFTRGEYLGDLRYSSNYSLTSTGTQSEALNRAGYPQSAFAILKYGICDDILKNRVDSVEVSQAGNLVAFDPEVFRFEGSYFGIHSLGSGDAHANEYYTLPQPATQLASRQDTVNYQIPLVEDLIITEMALEGAFEGYRFNDLMRVALRRNDPAYLANAVSRREGTVDDALRTLLMNSDNWYLPLP